jgi:hypothetical protein
MKLKKLIPITFFFLVLTLSLVWPKKSWAQYECGTNGHCTRYNECSGHFLGGQDDAECKEKFGEYYVCCVPNISNGGIFGKIELPEIFKYGSLKGGGLVNFLNNIFKLLIVVGGLYALFNIIMAGYGYMSAGDDPKKLEAAGAKIWQSLVGLLIIASAFVLAAIFGWLLFKDATLILKPKVYGP